MYRICILDDEYLTCLGLEKAVPWDTIGVEVAFTALDGKKGLELIRKEKPDLVLTDIRRPGLTGVDLVKELKKEGFDGEIIVLTAYRDFDYAVETYKSGIFSYLLKPVDNDELLKTVKEAIVKLNGKRKEKERKRNREGNLSRMESSFFYQLLHNITNEEFIQNSKKFEFEVPASGILFLLKKENPEEEDNLTETGNLLLSKVKEEGINYFVRPGEASYLAFIDSKEEEKILSILRKSFSLVEEKTDTIFTGSICSYSSPVEISLAYKTDKDNIKNKMFFGFNSIEIPKEDSISYRHYVAIQDFYRILSEHYKDDLSVSMVSERRNVSDSYLRHLLRKSLGRTFNDILTDYRISLSKSF